MIEIDDKDKIRFGIPTLGKSPDRASLEPETKIQPESSPNPIQTVISLNLFTFLDIRTSKDSKGIKSRVAGETKVLQ